MHSDNAEAIDVIDAMIFSGDTMADEGERSKFRAMMARWERELKYWDEADEETAAGAIDNEADEAFAEDWDRELLGDDHLILQNHDIGNK